MIGGLVDFFVLHDDEGRNNFDYAGCRAFLTTTGTIRKRERDFLSMSPLKSRQPNISFDREYRRRGEKVSIAVFVLALFVSLLWHCTALAVDYDQLGDLLGEAFGDEKRTCAVIRMLDREISARPDDESLRKMRIAAYGSLADPYSAKPDVDFLAAQHPDSPLFQLQKCLYAEATGAPQEENRLCYLRTAELCRQSGNVAAYSRSICSPCFWRIPQKGRQQCSSFSQR